MLFLQHRNARFSTLSGSLCLLVVGVVYISRDGALTRKLNYYSGSRRKNTDNQAEKGYDSSIHQTLIYTLLKTYPWLNRTNVIPNYFTIGMHSQHLNHENPIVFLHNHKSGGTNIKHCINQINNLTHNEPYDKLTHLRYYNFQSIYKQLDSVKLRPNSIFRGGYTFGVCNRLKKPCSYFTVLREPYDRMVSHYIYCHDNSNDHICRPKGSAKMTVNEWALSVGSHFFKQLFNDVDLCTATYRGEQDRRKLRCWQKLDDYLDNNLNEEERDVLLEYVVSNLHNWFTVIGITSHMDVTFELLDEAYDLPFVTRCKNDEYNLARKAHVESENITERNDMKVRLLADREVERVLRYDTLIYKQAFKIFEEEMAVLQQIKSS